MKTKEQNIAVSIAIIVVAILVGVYLMRRHVTPPASATADQTAVTGDKSFVLACADSKSMMVTFHLPEDKTLDLTLSDGRTLSLDNASTMAGARYTNADQSMVLGITDGNIFLNEGDKATYSNCVLNSAGGSGQTLGQ